MEPVFPTHEPAFLRRPNVPAGIALLLFGLAALADQYLHTGWLSFAILPVIGLALLLSGLRPRRMKRVIAGCLSGSLGVAVFLALTPLLNLSPLARAGAALAAFALGWGLIALTSALLGGPVLWWALLPGSVLGTVGGCLFFQRLGILDFTLWVSLGLGISLLAWGVFDHLIGLIIPGCLLGTAGLGVAIAWGPGLQGNPLMQTGVMLVVLALGWLSITIFSRVVKDAFLWWPLIPGGVLAVTGWGLYIGGNPGGAASFIGNTGSIGLIIFGLYLLLLRQGIKK